MAEKKDIDRVSLEVDYCAGVKSLRGLAREYGVSAPRIAQIANSEGWTRDLSARIKAEREARLNSEALNAPLNNELAVKRKVTERELVQANAEMQAGIIRAHRKDINRYRALCQSLLAQLEAETAEPALFDGLGELLAAPDDKGMDKPNEAYRKAISLPSRIDGAKKLAETLKTLIGMERQAFGLGDGPGSGVSGGDEHDELVATAEILRASFRVRVA